MRVSTCAQKADTADSGESCNTNGTTPATIPGRVFDSGTTRLLTGKSSTTSRPSALQPRTTSAQAAVITVDRGTFHAWHSCSTRRRIAGSNGTGSEDRYGSLSPTSSGKRLSCPVADGRFAIQYA